MLENAPVLSVNLMRPNSMLQSFDHYSLRVLGLTLMRFLAESESVLPSLLLCAALVAEVVLLLSFFLSHCWCRYRRRMFVFSVVITEGEEEVFLSVKMSNMNNVSNLTLFILWIWLILNSWKVNRRFLGGMRSTGRIRLELREVSLVIRWEPFQEFGNHV